MKKPVYDEQWPVLWKECYQYDLIELFGSKKELGYSYAYFNRFNTIIKFVQKYLPRGSRVLDIAAGQGNFSLTLAELGYNVVWNDMRENLIDYVKTKYQSGNIEFVSGNAFNLKFTSQFDGIIITEVIEHVAHPDKFLEKVASLLKPGGYIFMSTPLGSYFLNNLPRFSSCPDPSIFESMQFKPNCDGHIFLLYKDEIYTLAKKSNLVVEKMSVYSNPLSSGHIKTNVLLKALPRRAVALFENFTRKFPEPIKLKIHSGIATVFYK